MACRSTPRLPCPTAPGSTASPVCARCCGSHKEDFVRTLTGKLLAYAMGRGMEYYDQPAIRKIARDAAAARLPLVGHHLGNRRKRSVQHGRTVRGATEPATASRQQPRIDMGGRKMIRFKKAIPRRAMLRGIGAALALPLLDSMVPALSAMAETAAKPVNRFGVVYVPNGMIMQNYLPATEGAAYELTPTLSALAPFREHVLVLSGLNCVPTPGRPGGAHAKATTRFLTDISPPTSETWLDAGISMDQILAQETGKHTQLASLELAIEIRRNRGRLRHGIRLPLHQHDLLEERRTRRCRRRTIRGSYSSACSATAAAPIRRRASAACGRNERPRFRDGRGRRLQGALPADDRSQAHRVPGRHSRRRAAHPDRRRAERPASAGDGASRRHPGRLGRRTSS